MSGFALGKYGLRKPKISQDKFLCSYVTDSQEKNTGTKAQRASDWQTSHVLSHIIAVRILGICPHATPLGRTPGNLAPGFSWINPIHLFPFLILICILSL